MLGAVLAATAQGRPEIPLTEKEQETLARIAKILCEEFGLKDNIFKGRHQLCTGDRVIMEVRRTRHQMQVMINAPEKNDAVKRVLEKNGISYADGGMFLELLMPDAVGIYAGCKFPKIKKKNEGLIWSGEFNGMQIKLIASKPQRERDGVPITIYGLFLESVQFAHIEVYPERKYVREVQPLDRAMLLCVALCSAHDFPFRDFIVRDLEDVNIDLNSPKAKEITNNYLKESRRVLDLVAAYEKRAKLPGWQTTNPTEHDPNNFRYLVHCFRWGGQVQPFEDPNGIQQMHEYFTDPLINPSLLIGRGYISCSVIDETHFATWGETGLLLEIPVENIRKASAKDIVNLVRKDGSKDYHKRIPEAQAILNRSSPSSYNEIVVAGTNETTGSKIRIVGGFVAMDPLTAKDIDPKRAKEIESFCEERNLPVIRLYEPFCKVISFPAGDD